MLWETKYRMIFWAFGKREAVDLTVKTAQYLGKFGTDYKPIYLPDETKISLDTPSLTELFTKMRGKGTFFSTWLTSQNGLVFLLHLGVPLAGFPEVIQIGLEPNHIQEISVEQLIEVFKFGAHIFEPYYAWGCMSGEVNYSKLYGEKNATVDLTKVPAFIEWFNYFDQPMVERLGGVNKLLAVPAYRVQQVENSGGAILVLQEEAFDFQNPVHLHRREAVEKYLEFERLHKLYSKY
jgi:hypothetical protein